MLDLQQRILLPDGTSLMDEDEASRLILSLGELPSHVKVLPSADASVYELLYGVKVIHDGDCPDVSPEYDVTDEDVLIMLESLRNSDRLVLDKEQGEERLEKELVYFREKGYLPFLAVMKKTVDEFKASGVVWGVGRGSSCACYVLYLLEVHDLNPVKYSIDFSEFSKE